MTSVTLLFQQHRQLRQPPSFEQILARSGLRLSDLAIVALPGEEAEAALIDDSIDGGDDAGAPSESTLPPPGDYARHPNLYLPPYSIAASETDVDEAASLHYQVTTPPAELVDALFSSRLESSLFFTDARVVVDLMSAEQFSIFDCQ